MHTHPPASPVIGLPRSPGRAWLSAAGDHALGLATLDRLYRRRPQALSTADFVRYALDGLGIERGIDSGSVDSVPQTGPTLVIANHPYGAAEGLALTELLLRRRPDVRLLANELLQRLPELAPVITPIDVFRSGVNTQGLRAALRHLQGGGLLLVFPAGEVSRLDLKRRAVIDPPWSDTVATLARRTGARVVPIFVAGRASLTALSAGLVHSRLRTVLLARELIRLRGTRLALRIGEAVDSHELDAIPRAQQTDYLRLITYALGQGAAHPGPARRLQPLAPAGDADALTGEIEGLPADCHLLDHGPFSVYCAPADALPRTLPEIGRLRELSFRALDEGSGQPRDLDRYDAHYHHLFVWHREQGCIVGAYRLGFSEDILAAHGVGGCYTHSLFDFDAQLFTHLGASIEMGRSFVTPEWQRSFQPLRLLWSGIDRILRRHPQIRWLFGPVSISPRYSGTGRAVIAEALRLHHSDPQLTRMIRPRTPPRRHRIEALRPAAAALAEPKLLSRLVARIEHGPGLPVLLRQYLDLNGRFAGFNVDDSFGGALDGLVFVEVAGIPDKVRRRLVVSG
ncbi:MAG: lysophospholipid acyltransferase family protein [Nevskiales bacterium]|nr:lysophospholipid acyltransferase family protein [Nevskiales bacterium]